MKTIWRNNSSNLVPKAGMDYSVHVRRTASGWQWLLMIQEEVVETGRGKSKLACQEAVRQAKAARTGKAIIPLAPTGRRGERL